MRISEPLALLAIMIAAAATASAQSPLDQLKTYTESTPPPAKASTPAAGSGRSAAISLGAAVGKYDIVGIKLDIPFKEALAALKAHSPNFRLQPDSIKYAVLPYALTYGISAVNPSMVNYQDGRLIP